jgi:hypothetical protein
MSTGVRASLMRISNNRRNMTVREMGREEVAVNAFSEDLGIRATIHSPQREGVQAMAAARRRRRKR